MNKTNKGLLVAITLFLGGQALCSERNPQPSRCGLAGAAFLYMKETNNFLLGKKSSIQAQSSYSIAERPAQLPPVPCITRQQAMSAYVERVAAIPEQTAWKKKRNNIMAKHNMTVFRRALSFPEQAVCRNFRLRTAHDPEGLVTGIPGINEDNFQLILNFFMPLQNAWQLCHQLQFLKPSRTTPPIGYSSPLYHNDVARFPKLTDLGLAENEKVRRLDNPREIDQLLEMQKAARAKIRALTRELRILNFINLTVSNN